MFTYVNKLSIRSTLHLAFSFTLTLIIVVTAVNYYFTANVSRNISHTTKHALSLQNKVEEMRFIVTDTQRIALQSILMEDEELLMSATQQSLRFYKIIDDIKETLTAHHHNNLHPSHNNMIFLLDSNSMEKLEEFKNKYADYLKTILAIYANMVEGLDYKQDDVVLIKNLQYEFNAELDRILKNITGTIDKETDRIDSMIAIPIQLQLVSAFCVALVIVILTWLIEKKLTTPLNVLTQFVRNIGKNHDSRKVRTNLSGPSELATLSTGINQMLDDLEKITVSKEHLQTAKEEAEKANQTKSEFLSNMSHELRTPMNAILGFSQILDRDSQLNEEQQLCVTEILTAGDHLLTLINEVLDLAKIEAGKLNIDLATVSVAEVMTDCLGLIQPLTKEKNISIQDNTEEVGSLFCMADYTRLKQVMLNLLSNAIKYNKNNGTVTISTYLSDNNRIRIEISDSGIGIEKTAIEDLFKPFERVPSMQYIEGTGIGLSLSKKLVELMNGNIGVTSQLGVGSCFWIDIDGAVDNALNINTGLKNGLADIEKMPPHNSYRYKVLYIASDVTNLKLMEKIFTSRSDIKFVSAPNLNLGIELANAHLPDLLFIDTHSSSSFIQETLHKLLSHETIHFVPTILIGEENKIPNIAENNKIERIIKQLPHPINIEKITSLVDEMLEKSA